MQIAYGYRIDIVCDHETPVITMLDVHPDRAGDLAMPDVPQVTALATQQST